MQLTRSCLVAASISVFFLAESRTWAANLVINPGFETREPIGNGLPSTYGDWNGNRSSIVTSDNGITPRSGQRMLRIEGTSYSGDGAGASVGGNVVQIIDVSQWAAQIATGRVLLTVSAYFNRIGGDGQTDTEFGVDIFAFSDSPANYPSHGFSGYLRRQTNTFWSDANTSTWQQLSTTAVLPAGTTYVVIGVTAAENVFNDLSYPEFDGHYADDVDVTIDAPCIGDTDANHAVNTDDLLNIIVNWGACP